LKVQPLKVDFHRFFTIFEKTFPVPFVPCPNHVPGLSHAFSGTGKLLKKGHLALVFVLVPRILQTKISFWGGLRPFSGSIMAGIGPVCHTKAVQMGSIKAILYPDICHEKKGVPTKRPKKHE
jgi:hypothetical protein